MPFEIKTQWCVVVMEEVPVQVWEQGPDRTVTFHMEHHNKLDQMFGPFATNTEADAWAKDFNKVFDGSPWYADIWPMTTTTYD